MGAPGRKMNPASTTATPKSGGGGGALKKLFGRRSSHGGGASGTNHTKNAAASEEEHYVDTPRNSNAQAQQSSSPAAYHSSTTTPAETPKSLAASRQERKKGKRWSSVFKKSPQPHDASTESSPPPKPPRTPRRSKKANNDGAAGDNNDDDDAHSPVRIVAPHSQRGSAANAATPTGNANVTKLTPKDFVPWQETLKEEDPNKTLLFQKQLIKERDGFCRRVDSYDGQVIALDGNRPAYELGSYLGGGVAGVVYEGHRLRPMEEYPVRLGRGLGRNDLHSNTADLDNQSLADSLLGGVPGGGNGAATTTDNNDPSSSPPDLIAVPFFDCGATPQQAAETKPPQQQSNETPNYHSGRGPPANGAILTFDSLDESASMRRQRMCHEEAALEMTASNDQLVLIDDPDAPSRSSQYAKAVTMHHVESLHSYDGNFPSDASLAYSLMEETVAIKVLNPVGFRTMDPETLQTAVVARRGDKMDPAVLEGEQPMEERHVWWLINPNSRNLRTLQRYPPEQKGPRRVQVDRGSADKGLRISLIAAYRDKKGVLRELPLTRCIEIWGHVPFGASDEAFSSLVAAIDAINSGRPPPPMPAYWDLHKTQPILNDIPGRIGTASTANTTRDDASLESLPMTSKRTGIFRAATTQRTTVYCEELSAYIALPAVPSKYIKWLRQRRAATKEIRNMMLIGRHKNVVHLFEVLEYIQENKSTMFLILELVRGGELFDLISNGAAKLSQEDAIPPGFTETETAMRKFFAELAAGVRYCHSNGIAHRDLKPENLLVHNAPSGEVMLKIADFGLSAAFGPNGESQQFDDTVTLAESFISSIPAGAAGGDDQASLAGQSPNPVNGQNPDASPMKRSMDRIMSAGGTALSYFTCGVVDDVILNSCGPGTAMEDEPASPLKRMTSVVGSPHYVAPEIISQSDVKRKDKKGDSTPAGASVGYDGTKADVWSAGVILYAMLFRSLPFGEDLLRCPRYQSFSKWYAEVRKRGGRRSTTAGFLKPITDADERDMLGPQWFFPSQTSAESRDLIVAMLNPNPDVRPSINQVLKHAWLKKKADGGSS